VFRIRARCHQQIDGFGISAAQNLSFYFIQ